MTDSAPATIRVQAQAYVLGLAWGEIAELPIDTHELDACLSKGLVVALDVDGQPMQAPAPVFERRGGCGCGR